MSKNIKDEERLIVALDVDTIDKAKYIVQKIGDGCCFYKVGLELFMTGRSIELVQWLKRRGKRVFIDLKFFDVPQTVQKAVAQLDKYGADFATVHGNDAILRAAVAAKTATKILAVTVLTSLDKADMEDLGFTVDIEDIVLSRAKRAMALGCAGVIASGLEVQKLRSELEQGCIIINPGIRPLDNTAIDDQKRMVTPTQSIQSGADYIVIGRPITQAVDPGRAALAIQQEIALALTKVNQ